MRNDDAEAKTFDMERQRVETNIEARRPINDGFEERRFSPMSGVGNFIKDSRGWILFGPHDVRGEHLESGFLFCLQKLPGQKEPRVRVGCRYYTLRKAWEHWSFKARTGKLHAKERYGFSVNRNQGKQAIAIIRLMLLQAQAHRLLSLYAPVPKFDSSITKPKRMK